jgi:hypothetical protein
MGAWHTLDLAEFYVNGKLSHKGVNAFTLSKKR